MIEKSDAKEVRKSMCLSNDDLLDTALCPCALITLLTKISDILLV